LEEEDPAEADLEDTEEVLTQEMHHVDLEGGKKETRKPINSNQVKHLKQLL
jgi:hypothetical protein